MRRAESGAQRTDVRAEVSAEVSERRPEDRPPPDQIAWVLNALLDLDRSGVSATLQAPNHKIVESLPGLISTAYIDDAMVSLLDLLNGLYPLDRATGNCMFSVAVEDGKILRVDARVSAPLPSCTGGIVPPPHDLLRVVSGGEDFLPVQASRIMDAEVKAALERALKEAANGK